MYRRRSALLIRGKWWSLAVRVFLTNFFFLIKAQNISHSFYVQEYLLNFHKKMFRLGGTMHGRANYFRYIGGCFGGEGKESDFTTRQCETVITEHLKSVEMESNHFGLKIFPFRMPSGEWRMQWICVHRLSFVAKHNMEIVCAVLRGLSILFSIWFAFCFFFLYGPKIFVSITQTEMNKASKLLETMCVFHFFQIFNFRIRMLPILDYFSFIPHTHTKIWMLVQSEKNWLHNWLVMYDIHKRMFNNGFCMLYDMIEYTPIWMSPAAIPVIVWYTFIIKWLTEDDANHSIWLQIRWTIFFFCIFRLHFS